MPFLHDAKPSYTRPAKKIKVTVRSYQNTLLASLLHQAKSIIEEGGRRHRSGIGADPDGFLRRPIAPVQALGSAEDSNSGVFAYSAGKPR